MHPSYLVLVVGLLMSVPIAPMALAGEVAGFAAPGVIRANADLEVAFTAPISFSLLIEKVPPLPDVPIALVAKTVLLDQTSATDSVHSEKSNLLTLDATFQDGIFEFSQRYVPQLHPNPDKHLSPDDGVRISVKVRDPATFFCFGGEILELGSVPDRLTVNFGTGGCP